MTIASATTPLPPTVTRRTAPTLGGIDSRLTPPFLLPGEHFVAALVFWLAGAAMTVRVAPAIAAGSFAQAPVAATAHLFTLGWITTSIIGALYQLLPVALGVPIRSVRAAHASFALYVPGLALFVVGVATGSAAVLLPGAALLGTGLLVFLVNLGVTLWVATERSMTRWALSGAHLFLTVTLVLGLSLSGNLRWGYLGGERFLALAVHLHVAIFGWVLLVMIGVAHRLLPMFLLSHGADERPGPLAAGLVAAGVGGLVALHHDLTPALTWTIAGLIAAGVGAFLLQAALFFRASRKPALDPGMRLAGLGLLHLLAAFPLAGLFLARGLGAPRIATAYVVALVTGALSLFVAGHYYKIIPFLVWLHRFGPLLGKRPVPRVLDLYDTRIATGAGALLGLGSAGLLAATLAAPALARPAAVAYALGAAVVTAQMLAIFRRKA